MPHKRPSANCSAVILAGGLNSRMQGRNKAFLRVAGKTILDRLLDNLRPLFSEIVLVTRQPQLYRQISLRIVRDIYEARSSLTGIHAGLRAIRNLHAFVVPCDAPFLNPALVSLLVRKSRPRIDVVAPRVDGYLQALCTVYSKTCIPFIERQIENGAYKIVDFWGRVRVQAVSARSIRAVDPEMYSFFNVNTPADLEICQRIAAALEDTGTIASDQGNPTR